MQDKHPSEDLLQDEDFREDSYRALLLPIWFKFGLGFLIFFHGKELLGCVQLFNRFRALSTTPGPERTVTLGIYVMYVMLSVGIIATCFMFYRQLKNATRIGLPILVISLLAAIVTLVGYYFPGGEMHWRIIFNILNLVVLTVAVIHVFRIRKEWAVAVTVL